MLQYYYIHIFWHYEQNSSKRQQCDEDENDSIIARRVKQIKRFKESVFEEVDRNIKLAQAHQKKNYDKQHRALKFSVGEEVLKKNLKNKHRMGGKLDMKWLGPYVVTSVTEYGNYELRCAKSGKLLKQRVPITQLKRYIWPIELKVCRCLINYNRFKLCYFKYFMSHNLQTRPVVIRIP